MIDPSLQNALNTDALLMQAITAPSKLPVSIRKTGQPGLFRVLPEGWAEVTRWPLPGQDEFGAECEHWSGPVLADTDLLISIEIGMEPMSFQRSHRITVKYGTGVAA